MNLTSFKQPAGGRPQRGEILLNSKQRMYVYLYLYRIGVRITLKGENPYLHSVNSKNPEIILWLFSSITPGLTGTQFTAE